MDSAPSEVDINTMDTAQLEADIKTMDTAQSEADTQLADNQEDVLAGAQDGTATAGGNGQEQVVENL